MDWWIDLLGVINLLMEISWQFYALVVICGIVLGWLVVAAVRFIKGLLLE